MRWHDLVDLATRWPEVSASVSYSEPSLKVRNRLLAQHRLADDNVVLLDVPPAERDHLIEMMPGNFFTEPHYEAHDIVLARLDTLPRDIALRLLDRRWRSSATRRAVATYDDARKGS